MLAGLRRLVVVLAAFAAAAPAAPVPVNLCRCAGDGIHLILGAGRCDESSCAPRACCRKHAPAGPAASAPADAASCCVGVAFGGGEETAPAPAPEAPPSLALAPAQSPSLGVPSIAAGTLSFPAGLPPPPRCAARLPLRI